MRLGTVNGREPGIVVGAAGNALAVWAHREAAMRRAARSSDPVHVQYVGDGRIEAVGWGTRIVWCLPCPSAWN